MLRDPGLYLVVRVKVPELRKAVVPTLPPV